ncbi:hypothetical protein QT972_24375 [Microcoleus sp. herbarium7]|uniref:hypothetical protein n=1 Tax=Microcoleus sp. herbarium7 TaxID=3055435 RepID=UPI002FD4ED65
MRGNPQWTSPKLKSWLESDRQHYEMVEDIIKEHLKPEKICDFSFCRFIQIAVWREMDMVHDAVVDYLFESYNDQEDINEDEKDEDSDLE